MVIGWDGALGCWSTASMPIAKSVTRFNNFRRVKNLIPWWSKRKHYSLLSFPPGQRWRWPNSSSGRTPLQDLVVALQSEVASTEELVNTRAWSMFVLHVFPSVVTSWKLYHRHSFRFHTCRLSPQIVIKFAFRSCHGGGQFLLLVSLYHHLLHNAFNYGEGILLWWRLCGAEGGMFCSRSLHVSTLLILLMKNYILQYTKGLTAKASYHLRTLYLLTASDIKTTLLPATIFALIATLSGSLLVTSPSSLPTLTYYTLIPALLKSIVWTFVNLLLFNLSNQRLPSSILEDSINKPWRAIPSGRLSATSARHLLLTLTPLTILSTFYLGARNETLALIVLTYMYNDLGAADESFIIRHVTNALGFVSFGAGAAQVASSHISRGGGLSTTAFQWLAVIAMVITFTIQFQDMEDQEGDRERDRTTLPILLGDNWIRRLNALVMAVFSLMAPAFWGLGLTGFVLPVTIGGVVIWRTMMLRGLKDDKTTFKLWCIWLITLYCLPLAKGTGNFDGLWLIWSC